MEQKVEHCIWETIDMLIVEHEKKIETKLQLLLLFFVLVLFNINNVILSHIQTHTIHSHISDPLIIIERVKRVGTHARTHI